MTRHLATCLTALWLALCGLPASAAPPQDDASCLKCHDDLKPITIGKERQPLTCAKCHSALDGSTTPHANGGAFAGGLEAKGADSCLQCHGKEDYAKTRHGTLGSGCTGCHGAHAARHGTLVAEDTASTCYTCHKSADFEGKVTHKPVAQGDCADCHALHATEHPKLLSDPITEGCNACHGKVRKKPHAVSGFTNKGHPIGGETAGVTDPVNPMRPFYCGSCHDPHRSAERRLLRYGERSPTGFCQRCHRK